MFSLNLLSTGKSNFPLRPKVLREQIKLLLRNRNVDYELGASPEWKDIMCDLTMCAERSSEGMKVKLGRWSCVQLPGTVWAEEAFPKGEGPEAEWGGVACVDPALSSCPYLLSVRL